VRPIAPIGQIFNARKHVSVSERVFGCRATKAKV
jgi:hypothetical protein